MVRDNIVIPERDTVFNNLCLKYTGFHGIFVCAGNAVECGGNYDHFSVTDCYIYQCYDTGVSHQFSSGEALMQNITYARNVITHTDAAVEVFYSDTCMAKNVLIADNYFLYSGYGWFMGILGKDNYWGAAYQGHNYPNIAENFRMKNNVFYLSTGPLISTAAAKEHRPVMSGNTYVQNPDGILAQWPIGDEYDEFGVMRYLYSDEAADYVHDILGDEDGIVPGN